MDYIRKRWRLTCTWRSRRTGLTGWRRRSQNEPWISRKAWEASRGTSQPSQQDSERENIQMRAISHLNPPLFYKLLHTLIPHLSIALDQVLHVSLDRVQVLLDVVEVLNGLVGSHAARVTLLLDWSDLFQGLVKGVSATTKKIKNRKSGR